MHHFLGSVVELDAVDGLGTQEARAQFLDLPFLNSHASLFLQLDRRWCCLNCRKELNSGRLPKLAARNGLAITWAALHPSLRNLSQTELEVLSLARVSFFDCFHRPM